MLYCLLVVCSCGFVLGVGLVLMVGWLGQFACCVGVIAYCFYRGCCLLRLVF